MAKACKSSFSALKSILALSKQKGIKQKSLCVLLKEIFAFSSKRANSHLPKKLLIKILSPLLSHCAHFWRDSMSLGAFGIVILSPFLSRVILVGAKSTNSPHKLQKFLESRAAILCSSNGVKKPLFVRFSAFKICSVLKESNNTISLNAHCKERGIYCARFSLNAKMLCLSPVTSRQMESQSQVCSTHCPCNLESCNA